MNSHHFKDLVQTLFSGHDKTVNYEELKSVSSPFVASFLDNAHLNKNRHSFDRHFIVQEIYNLDDPHPLDKLFINFFIFFSKMMMFQKLEHIIAFPYKNQFQHWVILLSLLFKDTVTLFYKKTEWYNRDHNTLSLLLLEVSDGRVEHIRHTLSLLLNRDIPSTHYEMSALKKIVITPLNWGPLLWRILHFVAECLEVQHSHLNIVDAQKNWRQFQVHSLHRLLLCSICSSHYQNNILSKYRDRILNDTQPARLWFDIHNEVNRIMNIPLYPEVDFERD